MNKLLARLQLVRGISLLDKGAPLLDLALVALYLSSKEHQKQQPDSEAAAATAMALLVAPGSLGVGAGHARATVAGMQGPVTVEGRPPARVHCLRWGG